MHLEKKLEENNISKALILGNSFLRYLFGTELNGFTLIDISNRKNSLFVTPIDYNKALFILEKCKANFELIVYGRMVELLDIYATHVTTHDAIYLIKKIIDNEEKIGINVDSLPFELRSHIEKERREKVIDITNQLVKTRAEKTESEIKIIEKSSEITERSLFQTINEINSKTTTKELKKLLIGNLYKNGADSLAFDPIVAIDKDSSYPHPPNIHVTEKPVEKSSILLIDVGASINNYASDMTRIFIFSSSNKLLELAEFLEESYWVAIDNVSINRSCRETDLNVRRFMSRLGLDKFFIHSLGHGVGIEIHESPYISPFSKDVYNNNYVFTIEPGIYFKDNLGLRIENTLLLEKNKVKSLMKTPLVIT